MNYKSIYLSVILGCILTVFVMATGAYTLKETDSGSTIKWNSDSVSIRAHDDSFVSGSDEYDKLLDVISYLNDNPSDFTFSITVNDSSVDFNNGQNEVWFSSDTDVIDDAPAYARSWYYSSSGNLDEVDVVFNAARTWSYSFLKSDKTPYDGGGRPFATTALHEIGHAFGLGHEGLLYNVMGQDWDHIWANGPWAEGYLGEDTSNGAVALYGTNSTKGQDVSVSHWYWTGTSDDGYSKHDRTRVFNTSDVELTNLSSGDEPKYLVDIGQTVKVEFTYENNGLSTQEIEVGYYLSTNDTITLLDDLIETRTFTLGRNTVYTIARNVTLPSDLSPNTDYWIGAFIDHDLTLEENNELNNATYIGIRTSSQVAPTPTRFTVGTINPTIPVFRTPTPTPTLRRIGTPFIPTPIVPITPYPTLIPIREILIFDHIDLIDPVVDGGATLPEREEIILKWNVEEHVEADVFIYVQVNDETSRRLLGRVNDLDSGIFRWRKGADNVEQRFANGPLAGENYQFIFYIIPKSGVPRILDPVTSKTVKFTGSEDGSGEIPENGVVVTDNTDSFRDLSGDEDVDAPGDRELVIRWNVGTTDIKDVHVYVSVDGEQRTFLGRTGNGSDEFFRWNSSARFISGAFRNGPESGHEYLFTIFALTESGTPRVRGPFSAKAAVRFKVDDGVIVRPSPTGGTVRPTETPTQAAVFRTPTPTVTPTTPGVTGGKECIEAGDVFSAAVTGLSVVDLGKVQIREAVLPDGNPVALNVRDCNGDGNLDIEVPWSQSTALQFATIKFATDICGGKAPTAVEITLAHGTPIKLEGYDDSGALVASNSDPRSDAALVHSMVLSSPNGIREILIDGAETCIIRICWWCDSTVNPTPTFQTPPSNTPTRPQLPTFTPTPPRVNTPITPGIDIPNIIVLDTVGSTTDLSGGEDVDSSNAGGELVIQWRTDSWTVIQRGESVSVDLSNAVDFHVYVQVNGEERPQYLGRTGAGADSFVWKSGTRFLAGTYRDGPKNGESYLFSVFALRSGAPAVGPVQASGAVGFKLE